MIEKITKEVLEKLGFEPERAEELSKESITTRTIINDNHIFIDGVNRLVFSKNEGARKYYFKTDNIEFPTKCDSLREEYYNLKLKQYFNENKATGLTDSVLAKEFHNAEIQQTENEIATTKDRFKTFSKNPEFTKIKTRYLNWLKSKQSKEIKEANRNINPIKPKKEFKDFFNPDINIEVIEKIQKDFKDYIGKKMAYLIYILETDLKIISYSLNSKNDSRKHFVESLINKTISMQGINKHFEPNDVKLNVYRFENDYNYINTKEKLLKTIK